MDAARWTRVGVAVAMLIGASQLAHAEDGRPSRQVLEAMGLGSLVVMSDEEAITVRGQGFRGGSSAQAWGNSFATINGKNGGAHSENAYNADGKHFAKGSNSSYAGVIHISSGKKGKGGKGGHNGGMNGGSYGRRGGKSGHGGGYGGKPHGGKISIKATIFVSGGHSSAWAY